MHGRVDVAAAPAASAPHAAHAVLAGHAVGRHARAPDDQVAPHSGNRRLEDLLTAVQLVGTLEEAVGKLRDVLLRPRDAEQRVHLVVVRGHVGVRDRPVVAKPVPARGLEVVIRQPQRNAPPEVRLSSEHAGTHPGVPRSGRGILLLVHEPVACEGVA